LIPKIAPELALSPIQLFEKALMKDKLEPIISAEKQLIE